MHICHFTQISVESAYFRNLAKGLIEKGSQVSFAELGDHKSPKWFTDIPEAEYFSLGVTSKLYYPLAVWRLSRLIKREKVDILQTHLYFGGLIGVLAARLAGIPVILTRHHSDLLYHIGTSKHVALDKWMAEKADYVIAVSERVKRCMLEQDKIKNDNIKVIRYGFDFDELTFSEEGRTRIRYEFNFKKFHFVIGYVASFAKGKGQPQLIDAFHILSQHIPDARLLLIGKDGNVADCQKQAEQLGLKDKIIFAGWRSDIQDCLSAMDLFVQPSLSEAFSQVLIEAMGVGLPTVATDVGDAALVIESGKSGVVVSPQNPKEIADAVIFLYNQPEMRSQMAQFGRKNVRESYTVEKMIESQISLYKQLMKTQ